MELRAPLATAGLILALLAAAPAVASAEVQTLRSDSVVPEGFSMTGRQAVEISERDAKVKAGRERYPKLKPTPYTNGPGRWQVSWFESGHERVQVQIDDRTRGIVESWSGHQVAWKMARGYEGAFGQKWNTPWLLIPLGLLFLLPFFDFRRPLRLLHLDLLVLLAFGISHVYFNRGDIGVSVPLVYPVLFYVLGRMLWEGSRRRERTGPLVPHAPLNILLGGLVFLVGFRVGLNLIDSNVIDVGYSGVIGADRIADRESLYDGEFSPDNQSGNVYGPVAYLAYLPWEQIFPWSGAWDDLPAAHAGAISFDLATLAGLYVLGLRLQGRTLAVALGYAWAAYPYSLFALSTNTNDTLIAALLVWALVAVSRPAVRGGLVALAAAAKFAPLALAPVFASLGRPVRYGIAFAAVLALTIVPFLPDGGLRDFYDTTLGFHASRSSPFSVWGQEPGLDWLHTAVKVLAAGLALAVAFVPKQRDAVQVAALAAAALIGLQLAAVHWFYLYIVWFAPFVFAALFAAYGPRRDAEPA